MRNRFGSSCGVASAGLGADDAQQGHADDDYRHARHLPSAQALTVQEVRGNSDKGCELGSKNGGNGKLVAGTYGIAEDPEHFGRARGCH